MGCFLLLHPLPPPFPMTETPVYRTSFFVLGPASPRHTQLRDAVTNDPTSFEQLLPYTWTAGDTFLLYLNDDIALNPLTS